MKYVIMVSGRNLKISDDFKRDAGPRKKAVLSVACVTTRVVTAASVDEACKLAIASARQELEASIVNDHSDPPILEIEEIVREVKDDDVVNAPTKGFTFYPEEGPAH
jgi:hypothetical protein